MRFPAIDKRGADITGHRRRTQHRTRHREGARPQGAHVMFGGLDGDLSRRPPTAETIS